MNRFVRWYNQNRKTIWSVIAVIILIIGLIQLVNYFVSERNEKRISLYSNQTQNTTTNSTYNTITVDEEYSTVTGDTLSSTQQEQIEVIDVFIEYCNESDIESAYQLLTDECKEEMYPSLEDFQESYYQQIFGDASKNVSVENWVNNIYKVNFNEDFLSTGRYSTENTIQDYITVVEVDEQYKLNINGYVGREEIGASNTENNITVSIEESDTYMDYQIYKIKVVNNTENTILLDDGVDIDAMYIEDENGNQYSAYTHEINDGQLIVSPRETKELEIKYYSKYGSEKEIEKVVFSRMILDNETYTTYENKSLYRNYGSIEVEI